MKTGCACCSGVRAVNIECVQQDRAVGWRDFHGVPLRRAHGECISVPSSINRYFCQNGFIEKPQFFVTGARRNMFPLWKHHKLCVMDINDPELVVFYTHIFVRNYVVIFPSHNRLKSIRIQAHDTWQNNMYPKFSKINVFVLRHWFLGDVPVVLN